MAQEISAAEFADHPGLDEWQFVLGRLDATYRAPSFSAAADLVRAIAAASDAAAHHPDIDLRYPGVVHVVLTTHETGSVTDLDVELAASISALAAQAGATPTVPAGQAVEIAIDVLDVDAVRPFWKAVLGYVDDVPPGFDGQVTALRDPRRIGPALWFQQMDAPRPGRSRFHIDVTVPEHLADERVAAALAAGGRMVTDEYARSWWVLADPEGNEACVCTWQDRD